MGFLSPYGKWMKMAPWQMMTVDKQWWFSIAEIKITKGFFQANLIFLVDTKTW